MKTFRAVIAAILLFAALVPAQGAIAGKWQGETDNGAQIVLELTVKGTALTGTFARRGQAAAIEDGKVSKNTLTFRVKVGDQTEALTGEVAGDQIRLWLDRQGPSGAVVLARVKN